MVARRGGDSETTTTFKGDGGSVQAQDGAKARSWASTCVCTHEKAKGTAFGQRVGTLIGKAMAHRRRLGSPLQSSGGDPQSARGQRHLLGGPAMGKCMRVGA